MVDEKKPALKTPHNVIIENRKKLTVTGVTDLDSYDEQSVIAFTDIGEMCIRGENLHLNKIDVASGELSLEGDIYSITYSDSRQMKGGMLSRLFK